MFIKVIKCSNENYWYDNYIGKEFETISIDEEMDAYIVDNIDGTGKSMGNIFFEDCEVIDEISRENAFVPPQPPKTKEQILQETLDTIILNSL